MASVEQSFYCDHEEREQIHAHADADDGVESVSEYIRKQLRECDA